MHKVMMTTLWLVGSTAALAGPIFFTDFESGVPAQFSGAGVRTGTEGYPTLVPGFLSYYLRNASTGNPAAATVLTLSGLPAHPGIVLSFLLAAIDSWDDLEPPWGPDYFNIKVDGVTVSTCGPGACNTPSAYHFLAESDGSVAVNPEWGDQAFLVLLEVPHTASTLTIEWFASGAGWQGGNDESWAIDNVEVSLVPEPGGFLLLATGLAALGAARRYRRRRLDRPGGLSYR